MRLFYLSCFVTVIQCSRIVFNVMHASDSHVISLLPLAQRIQEDGNHIHWFSSHYKTKPFTFPPNFTVNHLVLPQDHILHEKIFPSMWNKVYTPDDFPRVWSSGDVALNKMIDNYKPELTNVLNDTWDLAVGDELFAVSSYALSLKVKERGSPFIMMVTTVATHLMRSHLSLGGSVLQRPSLFIKVGSAWNLDNFSSRFATVAHAIRIFFGVDFATTHKFATGLHRLGYSDFHLSELGKKASYWFTGEINPIVWPAPVSNEFLHVGFYCRPIDILPRNYKIFMEDPTSKGTVLIAFGSNVVWQYAPDSLVQAFVDGINELRDYRIIFTFNGHKKFMERLGSHVMVTQWAPQKEILAHNSTKAFITHGGLKSLKDSICGTVPLLIMPLFAEQPHNGELVRQTGIGEVIVKFEVTADKFAVAVRKLSDNPSFKRSMIRMRNFYLDRPISSLDLAAFAARRAMKTRDRYPTFKRKGMYLTFSQHFYFPIVGTVFLALYILSE